MGEEESEMKTAQEFSPKFREKIKKKNKVMIDRFQTNSSPFE
jgi:hypothetical protein